jgi:hypothetical protein
VGKWHYLTTLLEVILKSTRIYGLGQWVKGCGFRKNIIKENKRVFWKRLDCENLLMWIGKLEC